MFKTEGYIDVAIVDAYVAESKFPPKDNEINNRNELVQTFYDVVLHVQDAEGNTDDWHGEISNRTGTGTVAHLYRLDMTLETLQKIGFGVMSLPELEAQFVPNQDRTISIPNLIGIKCTATVAKTESKGRDGNMREFYNVKYLNALGANAPKKLTMEELLSRRNPSAPATPPPAAPVPAAPAAPVYPQQAQAYPQQAPAAAPTVPRGYPTPTTPPPVPAAPPPAPVHAGNAVPPPPPAAKQNCPY